MPDVTIDPTTQTQCFRSLIEGGYVWRDIDTGYVLYVDADASLVVGKTTDAGASWSIVVTVETDNVIKASWWFDRWTPGDTTGTFIHIAWIENVGDDIRYVSLDTSDDSLGTEAVVFDGASASTSAHTRSNLSITKARGGNLYVGGRIDNAGERGFFRSEDTGATWASRADVYDGNIDMLFLQPGNEADDQDIWAFYQDSTADELSIKVFDNSLNSWAETLISTGIVNGTDDLYNLGAACRLSDNHSIVAAWNDIDPATAIADLKVWDVTNASTITALTDAVVDVNENAWVSVFIDQQTDDIYIAHLHGGTLLATVDIKYVLSEDGGTTWGGQVTFSDDAADDHRLVMTGQGVNDDGGRFQIAWHNDDTNDLMTNTDNDIEIPTVTTVFSPATSVERELVIRAY